jgi:hypothetical protein
MACLADLADVDDPHERLRRILVFHENQRREMLQKFDEERIDRKWMNRNFGSVTNIAWRLDRLSNHVDRLSNDVDQALAAQRLDVNAQLLRAYYVALVLLLLLLLLLLV